MMSVRQKLNEHPRIAAALGAAIIVAGLCVIALQIFGDRPQTVDAKVFFSDDDGATWFAVDGDKIPPIDHNGRPAYRAWVCKCEKSGKIFVNHLERYTDADRQKIEEGGGLHKPATVNIHPEIKKPGAQDWVAADKPLAYEKIKEVACPDGSPVAQIVRPE